jgi:hypothetical protein
LYVLHTAPCYASRLLFKHTTNVSDMNITNKNAGLNSEVCSQTYAISFEQDAIENPYKINSITIRGCRAEV